MSRTNQRAEQELWSGRTHFKILFRPAMIQLLLLVLHVLAAVYIPSHTNWPWWDNWGQLSVQGLLIVLSLYYVITPLLRWRNATFTLTNRRVIKHWGVLYKHSLEIPLENITTVATEQGILDRIFRCGTLNLLDASSTQHRTQGKWNKGPDNRNLQGVRFYDVPRVVAVKELIDKARFNS